MAVTQAPERIEMVEVAEPVPGPGEALVRVERVGICGSDIHIYDGSHPYPLYPLTQGHEFSGEVVAFGGPYDGPVRIGERVAVEPLITCGACYPCRHGRSNCCTRIKVIGAHLDGALRELIALPTHTLYQAGELDADLAALVEPVSIGVQAVSRGMITAEDQVVVFGAGPIGQAVILAASDRGASVMAIDRLPKRLELARRLGAERTVLAGEEDPAEAVRVWTGGEGAAVTVDAVGAPAVIRACTDLVASAGRVVIIGLSNQEVSIPVIDFTRKEMTILGSRNNAGLFGVALDLVRRNQERVRQLITHRFPLERVPEAIRFAAEHPAEAEKVMIDIG
jgi:L-gulonate 5-dehydrogenase